MKNIEKKQKLGKRVPYTPTGAPQTRGSCGHALNRGGTFGAHSLKTSPNNPDVDLPPPAQGLKADLLVFILNEDGKPPMMKRNSSKRFYISHQKVLMLQTP